jgi:probable HAF family extracellular repeat protein
LSACTIVSNSIDIASILAKILTQNTYCWSAASGMIDLGTFGGSYGAATAVNEQSQVVGWSTENSGINRAFMWSETTGMVDLGTLGDGSYATDINDHLVWGSAFWC